MTSYSVPAHHAAGDSGFIAAYDAIVDDLTLIQSAVPAVSGGLTGAVAAIRFVGATVSGSPATGTFATGDVAGDQGGKIWVCTAGGSPGTWAQVGAGGGGTMTNPMTTAGDIIDAGGGGTPQRVAIGSTGQALVVSGGAPAWGSVGLAGGGTGQATAQSAMDALAGAVTSGDFLRGNGTHVVMDTIHAADVPQLADYAPSGLTGATTATRYVGGTTSGAPVSGTFSTGDWVVDQAGHVWVCTAGGTSGTWAAVGSSVVDYAPTGLTGATSASRYAGATTSGAPGSGTFSTGDFVITQDGHVFVCTAGGTPGTWANAGASAGVSTFNSRSGSVTPGNADYLAVSSGGLTGATTATRYVGGTAAAAPASGTFSTGDFVVTQSGLIFICTSGGTPGTWVNAASLDALLAGATFTGYMAPAVVALTDASTIAVNAALGNDFRVTITANRTMGSPSNPVDGQRIDFQVTQDGTGSRTITWNSVYDFGTDGAPTLTTTASKTDLIGFIYNAALTKWLCAGWKLGF